jgi:hypothetical protein
MMLKHISLLKDSINSLLILGITPVDYDGSGSVNDEFVDILGKNNFKEWNDFTKDKLGTAISASKIMFSAGD